VSARGRLIVLEGPDASGKTTQARLLADALTQRGLRALMVREPGGTEVGERIRAILLDPALEGMNVRSELFLFMAARAELCRTVIAPALDDGCVVISDRFLASSVVYQGMVGGLPPQKIIDLGALAVGDVRPALTIVLDLDSWQAAARMEAAGRTPDRIELRDPDYHQKVQAGYREYARWATESVRLIRADRSEEQIAIEVFEAALEVLE